MGAPPSGDEGGVAVRGGGSADHGERATRRYGDTVADPPTSRPAGAVSARERWDSRYRAVSPTFLPHPFVAEALAAGLPDGPVFEVACGRSGSAPALAAAGRRVVAVDVSGVALGQLSAESARRGLSGRVVTVRADLVERAGHGQLTGPSRATGGAGTPDDADTSDDTVPPGPFAFVFATLFWDAEVFRAALRVVAVGGLLGWEALAADEPRRYHVRHGALGDLLPSGWRVLTQTLVDDGRRRTTRLLARRER